MLSCFYIKQSSSQALASFSLWLRSTILFFLFTLVSAVYCLLLFINFRLSKAILVCAPPLSSTFFDWCSEGLWWPYSVIENSTLILQGASFTVTSYLQLTSWPYLTFFACQGTIFWDTLPFFVPALSSFQHTSSKFPSFLVAFYSFPHAFLSIYFTLPLSGFSRPPSLGLPLLFFFTIVSASVTLSSWILAHFWGWVAMRISSFHPGESTFLIIDAYLPVLLVSIWVFGRLILLF